MSLRSLIAILCLLAGTSGCWSPRTSAVTHPAPRRTASQPEERYEDRILAELNFARTDPAGYADLVAERLSTYNGTEGKRAIRECIAVLRRAKPRSPLAPSPHVTLAARDHVRDQSRSGRIGHTGSDGSTPFSRIDRYLTTRGAGENIQYGLFDPRDIVVELLIDDGIPGRGHRVNILDPNFVHVGVATGPHPRYRTMSVMDFTYAYDPL